MSELNNAETAAEAEEAAKAKAEAATEEATKSESETESNTDEVATADDSASTTDQTSKNSNDKMKYFSATNEFKEWRDNGDGTVTATDLHEPGTTYTFVRYNSSSTLQEMIPNLISVIERIGNDTNRIWVEDRFNFLRDIRYFIGHTWNANAGHLEVEGILETDPNLEAILNFWTNVLGRKPFVIFDVSEDLSLSEKMKEIVKTIKRLDYVENVNDPGKLFSSVREIICSKAYDTEDGTAKEWVNNASPKDKENFEFLLKNVYKNYKGPGKSMQYTKPGSLLDRNGLTEDAEKVINNWVKIGNSILSIDELYETDKSEFKRDAENIALNIQILLQDGDVYYGMPGVVPPKTITNFVNIYYNLGLSKNISYTSVNSNDLNLLSDSLGAANKEIGNNIFNLAKDDIVDYVKDWERAQELIKQHKANNEGTANADNDRANAPIGRAAQRLEVLNQTSERELLDQVHGAANKDEKNNAVVNLILKRRRGRNNTSNTTTEKAQSDQNAALSEAEEEQNSQNEARNQVDSPDAATEKTQGDQNVALSEAEESDAQENVNASNTATTSTQSNQAKVDFIPLGGFGSTLRSIMPTWLGGRSTEEQQLDHLINFIEENGITSSAQVSASTRGSYLAAINEVGQRIAVSRNETEEREKIYYFNGEVQDSSHSAAFATILRDFENLSNNN